MPPRSRTGLLRTLARLVTVPLWTKAVLCCALSQVFRKTWLSYICCLLERGTEVISLLSIPSCLAITEVLAPLGPWAVPEHLVVLGFQNIPLKQTLFQLSVGLPWGCGSWAPFPVSLAPWLSEVDSCLVAEALMVSEVGSGSGLL